MLTTAEKNILNSGNWSESITIIIAYWNIEYGTYSYKNTEDGKSFELTTGGWSENEELIDEISDTMFWVFWWQESKRGGYYKFKKD